MAVAFNKILIPVDFSLNTEIAVKKALELAGTDETTIHLLHVVRPGRKGLEPRFRAWVMERDLHQLKCNIRSTNPNISVKTNILRGYSVEQTIIECARMMNPDLVIIGKQHNHRRWFFSRLISPDVVAVKSDVVPVLISPNQARSITGQGSSSSPSGISCRKESWNGQSCWQKNTRPRSICSPSEKMPGQKTDSCHRSF